MPATFAIYSDASLTTELVTLEQSFASDGSDGAIDRLVYIGSTATGKKILAASDPDVDSIPISIVDSNGGDGQLAADIKLALTQGGLAAATGGAAITGPAQILSGAAQALAVWLRIDPSNLAEGTYTDLSISFGPVVERLQ